ncbi:hypothetical protein [Altericroceibacterium endophyticum]|uniref:Tail specific protease domain-containing protein n=1 Tax=Altericroceibacterium endophyticum TaxID=1808508 RepID=A0A6I4T7I5_9SPHN|nr:hypothetical protein [Altericroceibacterium endophyticum]MXO65943.1 hypothetical protein [Altericroceibacterium endophyticum]
MAGYVAEIATGMESALKQGQTFYREAEDEQASEAPPPQSADSDFTTPVYVVTWGGCGSACLDAVDYFTLFDNTKLIGAPTSADSTYMDVRTVDLPAGPGVAVIPLKVYRGRERKSGQFYRPDLQPEGLDWSRQDYLDAIRSDLGKGM